MDNPFSWDYLNAPLRDTPTFGPFSTFYVVLFIATFVVALIIYFWAGNRYASNRVLQRAFHIGAQWMMWICGIGLFFFAWRVMRVEAFGLYKRFWIYATFLAYAASMIYFAYYFLRIYPRRLAELEREREIRAYMPDRASTPRSARRSTRSRRNRAT